jgi:tetratricopeptide (TPR) repeat protein
MTAPLGFRTVLPPTTASSTRPLVIPRLEPDPINVAEELAARGSRPIPRDHLELIRALIAAGKFSRAVEQLDAVWQLDSEHEQAWYFRLWATIGEGKEQAALDLARTILPRLPGSAAIAFLQAHLEEHAGDPRGALEAALRASAAAPGREETAALVQRLVQLVADEPAGQSAATHAPEGVPLPQPAATLSLMGAALQGASLLHPAGSSRSLTPVLTPRIRQPDAVSSKRKSVTAKRFGFLALATVVAALWAIPDPVPAAIALAIVVVIVTRSMPRSSGRQN